MSFTQGSQSAIYLQPIDPLTEYRVYLVPFIFPIVKKPYAKRASNENAMTRSLQTCQHW